MKRTITFYGKTSDCFNLILKEDRKETLDYNDYPPLFLGDGDGIELEIDVETGKIIGWDKDKVLQELSEMKEECDE